MAGRGASGLSGILLVDKPAGMTSHDVVARVRRAAGEKRVGHAGTLDPAATGLLVVLVGPATRLEPYLSSASKSYRATIAFGAATDTDDAEGRIVRRADVPDQVAEHSFAEETLARFLGRSEQMPPAYSAIKVAGVTAHRAARSGTPIELTPRPIEVFEARLLALDAQAKTWDVEFTVSKGTYIRSLARDIGEAVGSAAHLCALRRTASGGLSVETAYALADVTSNGAEAVVGCFIDPMTALADMPLVGGDFDDVSNGRPIPLPDAEFAGSGQIFVVVCEDEVKALYREQGGKLVPETVLAQGIRRRV